MHRSLITLIGKTRQPGYYSLAVITARTQLQRLRGGTGAPRGRGFPRRVSPLQLGHVAPCPPSSAASHGIPSGTLGFSKFVLPVNQNSGSQAEHEKETNPWICAQPLQQGRPWSCCDPTSPSRKIPTPAWLSQHLGDLSGRFRAPARA